MELDVDKFDFERCEDEPIHIPESIQSYGYLFVLDPETWEIKVISENVEDLFVSKEKVLGQNFGDYLDASDDYYDFLNQSYERARDKSTRLPVMVNFREEAVSATDYHDYFAVIYDSEGQMVIELEPATQFRESYSAHHYIKLYAMSIAPKFKSFESLDTMAQEIVNTIRYVTGMERVVLYKFNEDQSGRVIAESKVDDMESYLDLFYPASDIPAQARELYKINWVRLTPDIQLSPSPLIPDTKESGRKPLDMTHSLLRSLSPIHQQYVQNQGLAASFSMSLVTHNDLWGMISCHSREPVYIPQDIRLQCENLSQLFSWHLYAKEEELYIQKKEHADKAIDQMLEKTSSEYSIVKVFEENEDEVLDIMDADGFMFYSETQVISIGTTPDIETVKEIYNSSREEKGEIFFSTDITDQVAAEASLNGIKGVLLIPLNERRHFYTAWFRKEKVQVQKWAGVPNEKEAAGSKRERLTPRSSFKVHIREIRGHSQDWDQNDIDMAGRFNKVFLAHALETHELMRRNLSNLEEQDRHKNEFLATLAHELRNPLSPISAGLTLLEGKNDYPEPQRKVIDTMKRQVRHMTKMINDLLDVSRITRGKVILEKRYISIQEVLNNALETCDSAIKNKNHTAHLHLPDEPLQVYGDTTRLDQIFANIINNAVKYTDPGGRIDITAREIKTQVSITIKDNGQGISEDKIGLIFTMFNQVDAANTQSQGGLGIGLTLVERLVSLHNGEISVNSKGLGQGTTFTVDLPLAENGHEDEQAVSETINRTTGANNKVLVVDDNPDILTMYEMLLHNLGYEVETVMNGQRALAVFDTFQPDFALIDIGLPDIDGYQLCGMLAEKPGGDETVFFSQSGWGSKNNIDKALDSGFTEHFVKPLEMTTLEEALKKYMK